MSTADEVSPVLVSVLRAMLSDIFRVGTLSCDGTPAELQAVREASRLGLAQWKIGRGYGITDAGRAYLAGVAK